MEVAFPFDIGFEVDHRENFVLIQWRDGILAKREASTVVKPKCDLLPFFLDFPSRRLSTNTAILEPCIIVVEITRYASKRSMLTTSPFLRRSSCVCFAWPAASVNL